MSLNLDCVGMNPAESVCAGLAKNPALVKCLSVQNFLQTENGGTRKLVSNLAWAVLNVKHVSMIIWTVLSMHKQQRPQQQGGQGGQGSQPQVILLRPEMANLLVGLSAWMLDFMLWILDDMTRLAESLKGKEITKEAILEKRMSTVFVPMFLGIPMLLLSLSSTSVTNM
jgi:hypothetical protein